MKRRKFRQFFHAWECLIFQHLQFKANRPKRDAGFFIFRWRFAACHRSLSGVTRDS
jgi:hypothetical protein